MSVVHRLVRVAAEEFGLGPADLRQPGPVDVGDAAVQVHPADALVGRVHHRLEFPGEDLEAAQTQGLRAGECGALHQDPQPVDLRRGEVLVTRAAQAEHADDPVPVQHGQVDLVPHFPLADQPRQAHRAFGSAGRDGTPLCRGPSGETLPQR
jgi:hypothetical protein